MPKQHSSEQPVGEQREPFQRQPLEGQPHGGEADLPFGGGGKVNQLLVPGWSVNGRLTATSPAREADDGDQGPQPPARTHGADVRPSG